MDPSEMNSPAVTGHRIVTLCMNPALDITTSTDVVRPTDKLRCAAARYDPGGGGINVALVAAVLGAQATAVFPAGGPAGELVHNLLVAEGLPVRRVPIGGSTRESITVNELHTSQQYRFVLPGPALTVDEQAECLLQIRRAAATAAIVVASGSLPPGVPEDFYQQVADVCDAIGATFLLDTSGGGLRHVNSGVFLLKPSLRELNEWARRELATETEQLAAASEVIARGAARYVLVSLGAAGGERRAAAARGLPVVELADDVVGDRGDGGGVAGGWRGSVHGLGLLTGWGHGFGRVRPSPRSPATLARGRGGGR